MESKIKAFISVGIHQLFTFHKVVITNSGKIGEWMPVTKIQCEDCGKLFYKINRNGN